MSLEEISATTMIKLAYLKALEDENFKVLPCEVFTKGYIRVYLESLSLDSSEGLRILQEDGVYSSKSPLKLLYADIVKRVPADAADVGRAGSGEQPVAANTHSQTFTPPDTSTNSKYNYSYYNDNSRDYTRHVVYLIVFLVFLAVIVYSSSKLFSAAREGSTAVVTRSVGDSSNQSLRNMPSSKKSTHLTGPLSDSGQTSGSTPSGKKTTSKSPDLKKTSQKSSDKIKESLNFMKMATAEASTPNQTQIKAVLRSQDKYKPEMKDIAKVQQKMKNITASLKSIKTTIEKNKSTVQKTLTGNSKSEISAPSESTGTQLEDVQAQLSDKPQIKSSETPSGDKEFTVADTAETSSRSSDAKAIDELNIHREDKTSVCELSSGDTN